MSDGELRDLERRAREGDLAAREAFVRARERQGLATRAVIACVHANLEALTAVLADIERRGIADVICLGDLVGYGPDPIACIELVRQRCRVCVKGLSDETLLSRGETLWAARAAARSLEPAREALSRRPELRDWLEALADTYEDGADLFVNGSPRDPLHEMVLEALADRAELVDAWFAPVRGRAFNARTHVPGALLRDGTWLPPEPAHFDEPVIVNVGSVGQPRDGDPRACYVTIAGPFVDWHRIAYDVEATIAKLVAAGAPEILARRLALGA